MNGLVLRKMREKEGRLRTGRKKGDMLLFFGDTCISIRWVLLCNTSSEDRTQHIKGPRHNPCVSSPFTHATNCLSDRQSLEANRLSSCTGGRLYNLSALNGPCFSRVACVNVRVCSLASHWHLVGVSGGRAVFLSKEVEVPCGRFGSSLLPFFKSNGVQS